MKVSFETQYNIFKHHWYFQRCFSHLLLLWTLYYSYKSDH